MADISPELKQFLTLTKATSTGKGFVARYLAEVILGNIHSLDEPNLRGFVTFIGIAHVNPDKARKLLEAE